CFHVTGVQTCALPISAGWDALREGEAPFVVIGDAALLRRQGRPVAAIADPAEAAAVFSRALPVLDRPLPAAVTPGRPDPANAPRSEVLRVGEVRILK